MSDKILKVKQDLRRLRKLANAIEAELRARQRICERLTYLRSIPSPSEEVRVEIIGCEYSISGLKLDAHIKEASELEGRYLAAITQLDPLDRAIIIDGYMNGKPYWKIGRDIGYTEAGVKKRIRISIDKIAAGIEVKSEK